MSGVTENQWSAPMLVSSRTGSGCDSEPLPSGEWTVPALNRPRIQRYPGRTIGRTTQLTMLTFVVHGLLVLDLAKGHGVVLPRQVEHDNGLRLDDGRSGDGVLVIQRRDVVDMFLHVGPVLVSMRRSRICTLTPLIEDVIVPSRFAPRRAWP